MKYTVEIMLCKKRRLEKYNLSKIKTQNLVLTLFIDFC